LAFDFELVRPFKMIPLVIVADRGVQRGKPALLGKRDVGGVIPVDSYGFTDG
jgi:hypothetical protein